MVNLERFQSRSPFVRTHYYTFTRHSYIQLQIYLFVFWHFLTLKMKDEYRATHFDNFLEQPLRLAVSDYPPGPRL